jgi:FKBP-type peptidyl-prolyl cis-trans isomerase FkpA
MKRIQQIALALLLPLTLAFAPGCGEQDEVTGEQAGQDAPARAADDDTFYALGFAVSRNLQEFDLSEQELDQVKQGLEDGVRGNDPRVEIEEYLPRLQEVAHERSQRAAAREQQEGASFLAEAATAPGAERTESGLIFDQIQEGTGASPTATDIVTVHYHGTLRDGTVFDSSRQRGEPATIPLEQVIPCWTEGVQKMKVGGKAKLICPPDLAYGDRPAGPIPPGSTLIFEVELLEIVEGIPGAGR